MSNTLGHILGLIHKVKDDSTKLQVILEFLQEEVGEDDEASSIPEAYEKLMRTIAEVIDCGMLFFVNTDTLETEEVSPDMEDPEDFASNYGSCDWAAKPQFYDWPHKLRFAPLSSYDTYPMMEAFAETIKDDAFRGHLIDVLRRPHPFARFKRIIDDSPYRQGWYAFKLKRTEAFVRRQIMAYLEDGVY